MNTYTNVNINFAKSSYVFSAETDHSDSFGIFIISNGWNKWNVHYLI